LNNLRRDIHSAFEVVEPPLGGVPERVVQTVLANERRQRKEPMTYQMRFPLALVAAVLLVAVAVAALVTWNALHTSNVLPAGDTFASQVSQLEARPLHVPTLPTQSKCTSGLFAGPGSFGAGPGLSSFGPQPVPGQRAYAWTTSWGYYLDYVLYSDNRISGPILVRARDVFTPERVIFIGQFAAGSVVGSDVIDGPPVPQRAELLLDSSHAKATVDAHGVRHAFVWNFIAGVPLGASSSSAWQIDGVDFSEAVVIC